MKLSTQTIQLLKNFANINSNLIVKAGNNIRTIAVTKETFVKATLPEEFPVDFQIHDLHEFLAVHSNFESPELEFFEDYLTFSQGNYDTKFRYGDLDIFRPDPSKTDIYKLNVNMPDPEVEFILTQNDLQSLLKACNTMKLKHIVFESEGDGVVSAKATDKDTPLSNVHSAKLDCEHYSKFEFIYAVENFKLIPGEYHVSLSSAKISRFELRGVDGYNVEYYVAPHMNSTYEKSPTSNKQEPQDVEEDDIPF